MKKGISILMVILILLVLTNSVTAEGETLDIEKVAIQSIKNSQNVQSVNRQITKLQENYADVNELSDTLRSTLSYSNSYQTALTSILLPLRFETILRQAANGQMVVTNAVQLSAYKDYIALLKANYALNIQQGLMNGFDADYRKAELQETLGLVSQSQLRLSEIAYLKAKYRYDSAQKGFDSATITINNLMGEDLTKQYATLLDDNIIPAAQIKSLNDYVNLALANRAEINNAQGTLDYQKKAYEYNKATIPTDFQFYLQQQDYVIDKAQNDVELTKIDVQQDITTLYRNLGSVMKNMAAMKELEAQAVLDYQAAEIKYKNSQISLQEFDEAKVTKAQADINYKNSQLDAWLMQTMMDKACGIGCQPSTKGTLSISGVSS